MEKGSDGVGRVLGNVWYTASTQTLAIISGQSITVLSILSEERISSQRAERKRKEVLE